MPRTRFQEVIALPALSMHVSLRKRTGSLRAALMLLLLLAATVATSSAQTFKTLYNFCSKISPSGVCLDGRNPYASLVQGANGDLYGVTEGGGAGTGGAGSGGTLFKITAAGKLTTLYNFCSQPSCTDGGFPGAELLLATDGNFYGVTEGGGAGAGSGGTVFKTTAAGKLTTLHNFCSQPSCSDGGAPNTGLVQATNGNFYGTTYYGGVYGNYGTAFEITPSRVFTSLHSFCALGLPCPDGFQPNGLIQATDGNLYGTTRRGNNDNISDGTFFQLTLSGTLNTRAYIYNPNGRFPNSALVQAANGNFYGTGDQGGEFGYGSAFEITPGGTVSTLYFFCQVDPSCSDGNDPNTLILAPDGNFYGTTELGGANNSGSVFQITSTGQLTTLHSFTGTDGAVPFGLLLDTDGTFYGTTSQGGPNLQGTIFSLATGLGPFIKTIPTSGQVGTKVTILGTNLTGATAVHFNGTAATFKVVGSSAIKTTVPVGATSGTVTVTTAGGATLNSNVAFQVP